MTSIDLDQYAFRRKCKNYFFLGLLWLVALLVIAPLVLIFIYLIIRGFPAVNWTLFAQLPSDPMSGGGGMANCMVGSLLLIGMASFIGIPIGVGAGIYLAEYGRGRTASLLRWMTDLLAAVPSILVGLFVYALMVHPVFSFIPFHGFSAYAGSTALMVIMVPVIVRTTEEVLKLMPKHLREAGLALGIPRWKVILRIVVPGCYSGVITGVILAVARVAGETAPLLFTAFGNSNWSTLSQPTASLPVEIYNYATGPFDNWHQQAWAAALILVLFVFALNLGTRVMAGRRPKYD